jgi:luciferase family oxidoreductase group 1
MTQNLELSVLDLIPVRGEQTTGQALAASHELVLRADALGYTRYWTAEHHNMPSVASTTPGVELMYLGQGTDRIRLGSGGVMLPNHAPLAIAEQFSLLNAVYGDRIDLGIGRAPGTDPVTSAAMRGHLGQAQLVDGDGHVVDPVQAFPQHIMDMLALLGPDGAQVELYGGRVQPLRATPHADSFAQVWLLGSSGYSAQLAAALGLPYVFAHHFSGHGTASALKLYRDGFSATATGAGQDPTPVPRTFLTVNVVTADTAAEAAELAEPYMYTMANLRVGAPLRTLPSVGTEVRGLITDAHRQVMDTMLQSWVVGDADDSAARIRQLAEDFKVDEVMIHPVAGSRADEPLDRTPARVRTLELLAQRLL